jgi:hypothetical protein
MENDAFFACEAGRYLPNPICRGPWDPQALHGRVIVALLAHEIERKHGEPGFMPARLTVDMYRPPGFAPIEVVTKVVRDGKRIRVVDAEFISDGTSQARATCQLLRRTENAPGRVWSPPAWSVPDPETIEPPPNRPGRGGMGGMWMTRNISGAMGTFGQRRVWIREARNCVAGTELSPFLRAASAADFASPISNAGDQGLGYINTDVTLHLHRMPIGEWIGLEVVNHQATDGVTLGACFMHDREGAVGSSTVVGVAQRRARRPPPA